jgi:hypothetical protein
LAGTGPVKTTSILNGITQCNAYVMRGGIVRDGPFQSLCCRHSVRRTFAITDAD